METPVNGVPVQALVFGSVHCEVHARHHGGGKAVPLHRVQLVPQFVRLAALVFTGSPAHVSALSGPTARSASGRLPRGCPPGAAASLPRVPVAFRPPASACWASSPAEGLRPSCDRPTGCRQQPGPRRGFHVPRIRDTTGVGAPFTPRPAVFPRPTLTTRSPLAASSNGQALSPWYSSRRPGLEITRHQQGFTCVHPSGLPLARCSPGRNGGPSAFSLGFAPPRAGPADARQSGNRSRTLIENYAPGITGLQPASSLAIRDLVSHVRTSFCLSPNPAQPPR